MWPHSNWSVSPLRNHAGRLEVLSLRSGRGVKFPHSVLQAGADKVVVNLLVAIMYRCLASVFDVLHCLHVGKRDRGARQDMFAAGLSSAPLSGP